jgi:hypothetical protein
MISKLKQIYWFVAFWLMGVAAVGTVALAIRSLLL